MLVTIQQDIAGGAGLTSNKHSSCASCLIISYLPTQLHPGHHQPVSSEPRDCRDANLPVPNSFRAPRTKETHYSITPIQPSEAIPSWWRSYVVITDQYYAGRIMSHVNIVKPSAHKQSLQPPMFPIASCMNYMFRSENLSMRPRVLREIKDVCCIYWLDTSLAVSTLLDMVTRSE